MGPFAIDEGLIDAGASETVVRMDHTGYLSELAHAHVPPLVLETFTQGSEAGPRPMTRRRGPFALSIGDPYPGPPSRARAQATRPPFCSMSSMNGVLAGAHQRARDGEELRDGLIA